VDSEVPETRDITASDMVYQHYYVWSERIIGFAAAVPAAEKKDTIFGAIFPKTWIGVGALK
jgi:hypothetical protein